MKEPNVKDNDGPWEMVFVSVSSCHGLVINFFSASFSFLFIISPLLYGNVGRKIMKLRNDDARKKLNPVRSKLLNADARDRKKGRNLSS